MSHVLSYAGQYFRIDITEVASADLPQRPGYIAWASDAFRELKQMPSHPCTRMMAGPPHPTRDEALRHAYDWLKSDWDAQQTKRPYKPRRLGAVIYTVTIFQDGSPFECQFDEFSDAKLFAKAAEKIVDASKVVVTNNESPQPLTVWERAK